MITRFSVRNYKSLRDVSVDLTKMHVLIGQNETGKTSILEALAGLCRSVDQPLDAMFTGPWDGVDLVTHGAAESVVVLSVVIAANGDGGQSEALTYELAVRFGLRGRSVVIENENVSVGDETWDLPWSANHAASLVQTLFAQGSPPPANMQAPCLDALRTVHDALCAVATYRWDPRMLRLPTVPDSQRKFRMETSGFGLAQLLDEILGDDRKTFDALEQRLTDLFPHVESLILKYEKAYGATVPMDSAVEILRQAEGKGIHFRMHGVSRLVPASQVSDGLMIVLAFLAVAHSPSTTRVLLLEEPEIGIHPERLKDVLGVLRAAVETTNELQVVLTTHSPHMLDNFESEDVSLCVREPNGDVSVRRLDKSSVVRRQSGVFTLGEIWTAEGDAALGRDEEAAAKEASDE